MELGPLLLRLAIDVAALALLVYGLFRRRHGRPDLCVVYALFNVGLFLALVVIAEGEIGIGVGFGLFAVLSIVRLRSEPYSNAELAYFFIAIVLALVTALEVGGPELAALLAAIAVGAAAVVDHPQLGHRASSRTEVTLESVFSDAAALRGRLEERLGGTIAELRVLEIDYVRETTRVAVRFEPRAQSADPGRHGAVAAHGR